MEQSGTSEWHGTGSLREGEREGICVIFPCEQDIRYKSYSLSRGQFMGAPTTKERQAVRPTKFAATVMALGVVSKKAAPRVRGWP